MVNSNRRQHCNSLKYDDTQVFNEVFVCLKKEDKILKIDDAEELYHLII